MSTQITYIELPEDQKKAAQELLRRFTIVFIAAFLAEIWLRLSPNLLQGMPERQWLEWLLVSLLGVSAYLLWNIAIWHKRPQADFIAYRPWYRATAAKGPIIALVVMLALTSLDFQLSSQAPLDSNGTAAAPATFDFGINFQQASDTVLLVAAFILGFYSRLANDVLGNIARFIFKGIYEETYRQEINDQSTKDGKAGKG